MFKSGGQYVRMMVASIAVTMLVGCGIARTRAAQDEVRANHAKAQAGEMKWSDHYRRAFVLVSAEPEFRGKSDTLRLYNEGIDHALAYESGKMTKEQFDATRRRMQIEASAASERVQRERAMEPSQPPPPLPQIGATEPRRPTNCWSTVSRSGRSIDTTCQ